MQKIWLTAALMAGTAGAQDDGTLRAAAAENRARIATRPDFIDGPRAELSEAEKALGHHGAVIIEGVIGTDGTMRAARVKASSGVPALDGIALAAATASRFTPAKDAAGVALPVLTSMPFELVAYKTPKGGLFEYRCAQWVRDMDWWRSVAPQRPWKEHELYKMQLGMMMLGMIQTARGDHAKMQTEIAGFETRWNAALDRCRAEPRKLQKDVLYR